MLHCCWYNNNLCDCILGNTAKDQILPTSSANGEKIVTILKIVQQGSFFIAYIISHCFVKFGFFVFSEISNPLLRNILTSINY